MVLLYRDLLRISEGFREYKSSDVLDVNITLFKIVSEKPIKKVVIDNLSLQTAKSEKEVTFHFLRTKNEKISVLKIFTFENDKENKPEIFYVSVQENSKIYDSYLLDNIQKVGSEAFRIIKGGFTYKNEDFESKLSNYAVGEEYNYEEIRKALKDIIKLSKDIARMPKVELIEKRLLVDSNSAKKIDSQSAVYFAEHPEHWHQEGNLMPKPMKVLTETFVENKDIYENQFIRYVVYKTNIFLERLCKGMKNKVSILDNKANEMDAKLRFQEVYGEMAKTLKAIKDRHKIDKKEAQNYLKSFRELAASLKTAEKALKDIKLNKSLQVRLTQKILYDKRYFRVFQLFNESIPEKEVVETALIEKSELLYNEYMFFVLLLISYALSATGFLTLQIEGIDERDSQSFENSDVIVFRGKLNSALEDIGFEMQSYSLKSDQYPGKIILRLFRGDEQKNILFHLNFSLNSSIDEDETRKINDLYSLYKDDRFHTNFIVTLLSLKEVFIKGKAEEDIIFKLSSMGNNFVKQSDYERYGNYKVGMLPLSIEDYHNFMNKLTGFIRLKLVEFNGLSFCSFCKNDSVVKISEGLYRCSSCKKEISFNLCKSCRSKKIKFLNKKVENRGSYEDTDTVDTLVKYHYNYEIKSRFLGACYDKYYSHSGGYCHNCGKCSRISKSCTRCKYFEEDLSNE